MAYCRRSEPNKVSQDIFRIWGQIQRLSCRQKAPKTRMPPGKLERKLSWSWAWVISIVRRKQSTLPYCWTEPLTNLDQTKLVHYIGTIIWQSWSRFRVRITRKKISPCCTCLLKPAAPQPLTLHYICLGLEGQLEHWSRLSTSLFSMFYDPLGIRLRLRISSSPRSFPSSFPSTSTCIRTK